MTTAKMFDLSAYFDFLDSGAIRIRGHRIGLEHVLEYYLDGYSPEEIAREFPGLPLEKVYAAITYYLANRADMDAYLTERRRRMERAYQEWRNDPSQLVERLRVVRERTDDYA